MRLSMTTKYCFLILVALSPLLIYSSLSALFFVNYYVRTAVTDTIYADNFSYRKYFSLRKGDSDEYLIDKLGYPLLLHIYRSDTQSGIAYVFIDENGNVSHIISLKEEEFYFDNTENLRLEDISNNYIKELGVIYREYWAYSQSYKAPWKTAFSAQFVLVNGEIISKRIHLLTD